MASSFSTDLKLELMVTGENAGTWGTKTNTNLNLLQQAIAGYQEVSIAGGAQTTALTMDNAAISNARNAVIKFTGTITGNQIVTIPSGIEKTYTIFNGTTGAFTVQFKTASGTGPTFSTTDKGIKLVYSDGTNVVDILTGPLSNVTIGSNLSVDGGTIKLDGNYPVGTSNVALGDGALDDPGLTGCQNTAVGSCALTANTTACCNTAVGDLALNLTTTGNSNTAVGATALQCNTTGINNTAIGRSTLLKNTTGCNNTALGIVASLCNTTGVCNTAIGHSANRLNETGSSNVAVGYEALCLNTVSNNTAVGHQALLCNSTGTYNVGIGHLANCKNSTGCRNTSIGALALRENTCVNNTAVGFRASRATTTGSGNVAVGSYALDANTTGANNVVVGFFALACNNESGVTAIGRFAGCAATLVSGAVMLGAYATGYTTDLTTGDRGIYIGAYANPSASGVNDEYVLGYNVQGKGSGSFFAGAACVFNGSNTTTWNQTSDERIKKNIVDSPKGLNHLKQIKVKNFNYRRDDEIEYIGPNGDRVKEGLKDTKLQVGIIAQETQSIFPEAISVGDNGLLSVNNDPIFWALVNSVKELSIQIDNLQNEINILKNN